MLIAQRGAQWEDVGAYVSSADVKKPELVIEVTPSGSPLLRGSCSSCPRVIFAVVGNTEENRRRMQQAFDMHFHEIHRN